MQTPTENQQLVTVSDLKQYAYCPRVVYYEYLRGLRRPRTYKMREGTSAEDRVALLEQARSLRAYGLADGERVFNVRLVAPRAGLSGLVDLVIRRSDESVPIEFKNTTEGVQANHRLQLAAYAVLLEEAGWPPVRTGFVYQIPRRQATAVTIGDADRARVAAAVTAIRRMLERETFPPPTPVRNRCLDCEFRNWCNDVW